MGNIETVKPSKEAEEEDKKREEQRKKTSVPEVDEKNPPKVTGQPTEPAKKQDLKLEHEEEQKKKSK
jgi:hypothetical protein